MVAVQPTPKLIMESTTIIRAASYRHSPSSSTRSYHYYYRRKSVARAVKHPRRPTAKMTPSSISLADVPCSVRDMDNISLSTLSKQDNHVQALEEMLKRHIMKVDKVDYHQACLVLEEIEKVNHKWEHFMALPFQIAILTCGAGALLAFPLVFHLPTVEYFNEYYVTAEHPQPKELETWLEVGSWSWNWMVRAILWNVVCWHKKYHTTTTHVSWHVMAANAPPNTLCYIRNPFWARPRLCSCVYST